MDDLDRAGLADDMRLIGEDLDQWMGYAEPPIWEGIALAVRVLLSIGNALARRNR